jgi:hypothetical protein
MANLDSYMFQDVKILPNSDPTIASIYFDVYYRQVSKDHNVTYPIKDISLNYTEPFDLTDLNSIK